MDNKKFDVIIKEAEQDIAKMLKDHSDILGMSDYKEFWKNTTPEKFKRIGESLEYIRSIVYGNETRTIKTAFLGFYFLTILKDDERYKLLFVETISYFNLYDNMKKRHNHANENNQEFNRMYEYLKRFRDDCVKFDGTLERSRDILKSMKKEVYSLIRKNYKTRYKKSFRKDMYTVTYDIPITIRFAHAGISSEKEIIKTLDFFIGDDLKFESKKIEDFAFMVNYSLDAVFERCISMFQPIYGNKISFSLMIDLIDLENCFGSVLGLKRKEYGGNKLFISRYDHNCKIMEINIDCFFLQDCIADGNLKDITDTFIHEFNHLFDTKIESENLSDIIRNEGIARFSEIVFNNTPIDINEKIIRKFQVNPLSSIYEYEQSASKDNKTPYVLGSYMCYTMFMYYLSLNEETKKIVDNTIFITKPDARILRIMNEQAIHTAGENFLRIIRHLSAADFYTYYLRAEKSEPIITEQFLRVFIERKNRDRLLHS